jgi:hypothetical protein
MRMAPDRKPPMPMSQDPATKPVIDQETAYKTPIFEMLSLKGRVTVLTGEAFVLITIILC